MLTESCRLMAVVQSPDLLAQLEETVAPYGCHLEYVKDEIEAAQRLQEGDWDAVLLEIQSTHQVLAVSSYLRQFSTRPFIALVTQVYLVNIVKGYQAGIDTHLVAPFDSREFVARVNAILRRVQAKRGRRYIADSQSNK